MDVFDLWESALDHCHQYLGQLMFDERDNSRLSYLAIGHIAGFINETRKLETFL